MAWRKTNVAERSCACVIWLGMCVALLMVSGCATRSVPRWSAEPYPAYDADGELIEPATLTEEDRERMTAPPTPTQVVLQPYDAVRFRFLYWPELDDEQVIRPDGKISLLMVGEVQAQGKTPAELQQELTYLYEPMLRDPEINVVVSNLASNRAYVFGSVMAPGVILLEGKQTLLGAIAEAGGFLEPNANKSMVVVVRDIEGHQYARSVNIKETINNPGAVATFYIEPYDIVYVPETTITKMNQFVAQYIDGVIPDTARIGFSYSLGGRSTRVSTGTTSSPWQRLPALNINTGD